MPDLNEQLRAEFEAAEIDHWQRRQAIPLTDDEKVYLVRRYEDGTYVACEQRWTGFQFARRQHGSAAQAVGKVIDGVFWPEGYCTDPNGVIVAPAGRKQDFDFGYDIGYAEGLVAIKDSVKAIEERVRTAPPVADAEGVKAIYEATAALAQLQLADDDEREALLVQVRKISAALSRRPAAAAEPSDGEIYQTVSERHASPELRAAVAEEMAEIAAAVRAEVAAEQPAAEPELLPLPDDLAYLTEYVPDAAARAELKRKIAAHLSAAGQGKDSEREFVVFGGKRMGRNYLARLEADKLCLDEFAKHTNWELASEYDEDDLIWCVNKRGGSPNDREWIEVGRGTTPRAAIDAAMKAGAQGGGK